MSVLAHIRRWWPATPHHRRSAVMRCTVRFLLLFSVLLALAGTGHAQLVFTVTNEFEGRVFVSEVAREALEKAPKWKMTEAEHPPLSPAKAAELAEGSVKWLLESPLTGQLIQPYTFSINLRTTPLPDSWIYEVGVWPLHPGTGSPPSFKLFVLMDGSVAKLNEITDQSSQKSSRTKALGR